ncbi:hypothetical protein O1D97_15815 [Marinomonas sp. 15G1-11]|uniref:STAS domain-containing protein n=1 Tax=Marinomonas phaeophyticola TaxID=3004091 RepID=A0ABT4JXC6_9GAMM|nr:hypothetical protein [Marinomonas sp. 15G1-11]MCZ2723042.1 hypothetical protein [Marinomonas sp. 15G1-11]
MISCRVEGRTVYLEGKYDSNQLASLQKRLFEFIVASSEESVINLEKVSGSGSGLVAVLIACIRLSIKSGKKLLLQDLVIS